MQAAQEGARGARCHWDWVILLSVVSYVAAPSSRAGVFLK